MVTSTRKKSEGKFVKQVLLIIFIHYLLSFTLTRFDKMNISHNID